MPRIIYKNAAGKRLVGVTTISGVKFDTGGLMYWANQGGLDGKSLDDLYGESSVPGTLAHQMIEDFLHGKETDTSEYSPEVINMAETSFLNFTAWWDQNEVKPILIEPNLVSEEMQVGGTPDLIAMVNGKRCLIDWKSGKPLAYTSTLLQMAAYGMIYSEAYGAIIEAFYVVVIPRKSDNLTFTVNYREGISGLACEQFKLLRQVYENEKALKKTL